MSKVNATEELEVTIPKIFHRIWLGKQQMPDEFVWYGETWAKHHPDWTMLLWTDENLPDLINQQEFLLAETTSYKSDILRYEVIYRYGGIYIDTDLECLRNIEPLLKGVHAFAAQENAHILCAAIFGAEQGHPLMADLVSWLSDSFRRNRHLSNSEQTGPRFFTSMVARHPETVVFEAKLFYPYHWSEKWRKGQTFPDAYAIHHWSGSWIESEQQRIASTPVLRRIMCKLNSKLLAIASTTGNNKQYWRR
jgi:mannosyltransferase OCH1-like enzyme